jgi:DNA polymerase-4
MLRKIIHIDMDAFFAAVEQRDNPALRGKPIIVGGPPDSRGVVATCSYEARTFGVRSAMPCSQAHRLCPSAIFVPPRFEAYKQVAYQVRNIFYEVTDLVEPLSLDEAYLDVTENKLDEPIATTIAVWIKNRIKSETGLTASAGVAGGKFLAKIASDLRKPDGLFVIRPEKSQRFIDKLPIGKFHGIGRVTEQKMIGLGIKTGLDLRNTPLEEIIHHFGKSGLYYYDIAHGKDDRPVQPDHIRKSVGAENTFEEDMTSVADMEAELQRIALTVADRLRRIETKGRTITLKVRYHDFERSTRSYSLSRYVDEPDVLYHVARDLLPATDASTRPVRLLGISVSNLDLEESLLYGRQLEFDFIEDVTEAPY